MYLALTIDVVIKWYVGSIVGYVSWSIYLTCLECMWFCGILVPGFLYQDYVRVQGIQIQAMKGFHLVGIVTIAWCSYTAFW